MTQIKLGSTAIALNFGVPRRSGALKNSFKLTNNGNQVEISTDIYYMPFTNEPWISPRWKGAKNPNEKWFEEGQITLTLECASWTPALWPTISPDLRSSKDLFNKSSFLLRGEGPTSVVSFRRCDLFEGERSSFSLPGHHVYEVN